MFVLPELKYSYFALEPYFDTATVELHHQGHHANYIKNLNQALVEQDANCDRIENLFDRASELSPQIRNNAGAHYNHTLFWSILGAGMTTPSSRLMDLIIARFGVLEDFKAEFTKQALSVFGSGWVWLVYTNEGTLEIVTTRNQDTPLMDDIFTGYPLLGLDMWEHAYYLRYQNRRLEYINAFWSVLNWDEVSRRLAEKPEMNDIN